MHLPRPLIVKEFLVKQCFRNLFIALFLIFVAIIFLLCIRSNIISVVFNKETDVKNDSASNRSKYSRMDQVKFVEDSL